MIRLLLAVIVLGRVGSLAEAGSSIPTVSFKSSSGGGQVTFVRKGATKDGAQIVKVTLAEAVTPRDPSTGMATGKRQWRAVRIVMSGADAPACSLLYPVLALGRGGAAALSALQGQGLDCSVADAGSVDCQTQVSADTCTGLASQLAENIDAVLAVDDAPERGAFQSGSAALGIAVCATTTTTTTTATTTTTIAGGSTTTVVTATTTTTTIPCGFVAGSGGSAAGMCGGSCPPGQTCLMNSPSGTKCQCQNPGIVCANNTSCGIGACPVQFEHCQPTPSACGCCTMDGDPCNATTVCCSGQACDLTFHCPSSTTTTTTSPATTTTSGAATTSTSSTTSTTAACVPQGGHCTTSADCCPGTGVFCNTSGGAGTGFCDVGA